MNKTDKKGIPFSRENLADTIRIWNHAPISLVEIRHNLIAPSDAVRGYLMPSSAFVYTSGTKAEVLLNDTSYRMERFGIFHGGKGTELSITPINDWLEYYMVIYKVGEPAFHKREYSRILERVNPFKQQYGFAPDNPLFFASQLQKMFERWQSPTALNLFYGKAAFYQLVYQVLEELDQGKIHVFEPDVIEMAKRYLDQHYAEQVSIHDLRETLGISSTHFHRLFTSKTGQSAQEYLISKRLSSVKKYLRETDYTIREIALMCGFSDEFSLMRMFQRRFHMSTSEFRDMDTYSRGTRAMENLIPFPYNKQNLVSLDQLKGEGAKDMFKQMSSKAVVAMALSLMLLLSACGTTPADNRGTSAPEAGITTQVQSEGGTRIVSTPSGDVEVPENPQRVVAQYIMGDLALLGLIPVGISDLYDGAAFSDVFSDVANLGHFAEWDPESVMALEPDLILVIDEADVKKFSPIAPTVYVPQGNMSQDERVAFVGELLNRQEEAAEAINAYHTNLAAAKSKLSEAGFDEDTVSVFEGGLEGITVIGSKYNVGVAVYDSLGLNAPEAVQTNIIGKDTYSEMVSFEVLPEYSGDYIFLNVYEGMDDLSQSAVWNSLTAVKNNRVIEIEFGFSYYSDLYSAIAQINYVTEALLRAAK